MRAPRLALAVLLLSTALPAAAGEIAPRLREAIATAAPAERLPVVVLMREFPAPSRLQGDVRGMNRARRRAHVVAAMRDLAARSQRGVADALAAEQAQGDRVRDVRVLWGVNGVALEATPDVVERLAARPDVEWVLLDRAAPHADASADGGGEGLPGPNPDATVAPDVIAHGAKRVWDELGYTGAGIVVAVIDTGIDTTHPDLADHMWRNPGEVAGNGLDDDHNGHVDDTYGWDFCANSLPVVGTHGTQVAGQVAGDGTNGTVTGMAPDAVLMSLGIDCDTPSRAWQASDYALAEGADLITQSYSWWWTDRPDYAGFRRQTDVELAAGMIHAQSGGNNGGQASYPVPYNISTPANCPPPWLHPDQAIRAGLSSIVAVGNVAWGLDVIAGSSSVGPSAWESIRANTDPAYPHENPPEYQDYPYENGARTGLLKPDLAAYGNGTNSTCPGAYYCQFSGTSSATPHVSGALALMLQSNAEATPEELARALMQTAQHRGDPGKNNVYGAGLLQAYEAVRAVESGVVYKTHAVDDTAHGNGDLRLDPGETAVLQITVESRTDEPVEGLEAILSTATPGVTIHDRYALFPPLPGRGAQGTSLAPHFSLTVAPEACTTIVVFDLELRYAGKVRRSTFAVRIGEEQPVVLLDDSFESDLGWTSDHGVATQGFWVRQDPIGVRDGQSRLANPEDDTSPAGTLCYVTGNGELTGKKDENNNDVDGGVVALVSPPFGRRHMLSLNLSYDRWYYDVASGNSLKVDVSNDGGQTWTLLESSNYQAGGWQSKSFDLFALLPPTDDMRLRFRADDDFADDAVEAAVDQVHVDGSWVACQDYAPPAVPRPNPVGDTLRLARADGGHVLLTWSAPPVDAGHGAAALYRIERAPAPQGPWAEAGTATSTTWLDLDAQRSPSFYQYRVTAENSGGRE